MMGIVSDEELGKELENLNKVPSVHIPVLIPEIVEMDRAGRKDGDNNVPNSLRKIIGEEAAINGRASGLALAEMFDVSPSSVSAYTKGATSTTSYQAPKVDILSHINKHKERISKKARRVAIQALNQITEENLAEVKPKDLASIAKDMAVVIKTMEPDVPDGAKDQKSVTFVMYKPELKSESHYNTIHVKE